MKYFSWLIGCTLAVSFYTSCKRQGNFLNAYPYETLTLNSSKHHEATLQPQFRVIGYLPTWAGEINNVQFDKLTHINYSFVLPTATGELKDVENIPKLQSLILKAHENNIKVLISIGGWNYGDDSGFESLASSSIYRTKFTVNLLNLITKYNADGIDIDWEAPEAGVSANNFSLMMHELSSKLHYKGKILSASVSIDHGSSVNKNIFDYVDYLNLMAYDGREGDNHSPYSLATTYHKYWKKRGLPKNKAVLGIPFYGRSPSEYVLYNTILARGGSVYSDNFGDIGYNGIPTVKNKTSLALKEFGGISIWELSGDSTGKYSLLNAINQVINQ